ncbi:MAG TPA: hypothetical protein VN549_01680, partial [Negativicutes bacterium]|nr:hypothetical protein [Negativicutes bacterium]
ALMLAISFTLSACSADSLGAYKKAAEKTDQIKRGQTGGEFSLTMDFDTKGMTEEEIKKHDYFREVKGSFSVVSDNEAGKGIYRNYLNLGGIGFDLDMFVNGDEACVKLPVIGKYMKLDSLQQSEADTQKGGKSELVSQETLDGINGIWLGMLRKDDIFKGKSIVLTTPDGEVKATEYTIKLKDEQIKALAAGSIGLLLKDEKLKENYEKLAAKDIEPLKGKTIEELLSDMNKRLDSYNMESFSYTAYVDIDGYIVNERLEFSMKVDNEGEAGVTGVAYKLDIKNWDINKEQKFDFPVLTEENTLNPDSMDANMPSVFQNLFKNKD